MSTYEAELEKHEIESLLHLEERIDKYRPGGYHPVSIEDTFSNGRYTVYNKLGHGGSSTVWLALDESTDEWVAMKILTAEKSQNPRELRSYQRLAKLPQESGISTFFVQLRDHFFHQGPNGNHLCLVTELLGPRLPAVLEELSDKDRWLAPNIVLKVAQKLLEAIEVLHRTGFSHGDLNMNNIVFTCHRLTSSEGRIWIELTAPLCSKLVRRDGKPLSPSVPKEYVETEKWYDWNDAEFEDIKILDLGEVFSQEEKPSPCVLPGECRAPEVIFEDSFDQRTDLWQAGCAIYMLVFHMFPFSAFDGYETLVLTIMDILGDLPKEWVTRWGSIQQASRSPEPLEPERANGRRPNPLIYYGTEKFPEETLRILVPVIKGLLTYKRSSRLSASQALHMLEKLKIEERDGRPVLS